MAENLPNQGRDLDIQVHEAHTYQTKSTSRDHLQDRELRDCQKSEKRILASRSKKIITCKGTPLSLSVDYSAETLQARREWDDIFKVLKETAN